MGPQTGPKSGMTAARDCAFPRCSTTNMSPTILEFSVCDPIVMPFKSRNATNMPMFWLRADPVENKMNKMFAML